MKVTALLCADRAPPEPPTAAPSDVEVRLVAGLCPHPELIEAHSVASDRLILGLCGGDYSLGRVQTSVRAGGVDPLGLYVVDLPEEGVDADTLATLLAGAAARVRAFAGSRPEHAKLRMAREVSRRALLTLSTTEYLPAPSIDADACVARFGCRACVGVCPQTALTWSNGRILYDKYSCEPCGRCVTACPAGAVVNPATTPGQIRDQIRALLAHSSPVGPRGIIFTCVQGRAADRPSGWFDVKVPCTGMVTAGWLLAPLAMGAGAVASEPCATSGCPLGNDASTDQAAAFCRELVAEFGGDPQRVAIPPLGPVPEPLGVVESLRDPFGPVGASEVLLGLAAALSPEREHRVSHAAAPTGVVAIDPVTCTVCGMCAQVCAPGALVFEETSDGVILSFEATRCTGCAQCVGRCPEIANGAIAMTRLVDTAQLRAGRQPLREAGVERCEVCGGPVASSELLDRIGQLLGDEHAATLAVVSRRCIDCRGR